MRIIMITLLVLLGLFGSKNMENNSSIDAGNSTDDEFVVSVDENINASGIDGNVVIEIPEGQASGGF